MVEPAPVTDDEDARPQRRRPLIAGSGWLLFVCLFLPTLRVCGDPTAPIEFPFAYVAYLGAAVLGIIAMLFKARTRRVWFTVWFTLWYATAVAWLTLLTVSIVEIAGAITAGVGLICVFILAPAFHRQRFTPGGMWIGGIVHGLLSMAWYVLLSGDDDAMWGAPTGLVISTLFTVSCAIALTQHKAEVARREPAELPVARIVV